MAFHHRCRTERRNQAEEHETPQLEHAVFDAAWHADVEDVLHQAHIDTKAADIGQVQHQIAVEEQREDDDCRDRAGHERRDRDARDIHTEAKDQNGVADHVDTVHQERNFERHVAVAHRAEQRRAAVVERDAGDGRHHI